MRDLFEERGITPDQISHMTGQMPRPMDESNEEGYTLGMPSKEAEKKEKLNKLKEFQSWLHNPDTIKDMINWSAGSPGVKAISPAINAGGSKALQLGKKGIEYLKPEKKANEFIETLGKGTASENIKDIGEEVKGSFESRKAEALKHKEELYPKEGGKNLYEIEKSKLPEGNLEKLSEIIEPGEKFTGEKSKAVTSALKKYRKSGNIESFLEESEDIFNVPELSKSQASKIEDALLMETKRESKYFTKDVADVYNKKGELYKLHQTYLKNPTLNNYDKLQSALKTESRRLKGVARTSESAKPKYDAIQENIANLNADKEAFMKTLPEKMQNLENEFRTSWREHVVPYQEAGNTIRKLANGKWEEIEPSQLAKAFTYNNKMTRKVLDDVGEKIGKKLIYNAVKNVPEGDYKKLAETLLDLKQTKGYDRFITKEIEDWAHNMLKHGNRAENIIKAMKATGGGLAGSLAGGILGHPGIGASIGAIAPFSGDLGKMIMKQFGKRT